MFLLFESMQYSASCSHCITANSCSAVTAVSRPGAPRTPQVEVVRHENLEFEVWDLGGQANLRPSWATYYRGKGLVLCTVLARRTGTACRLPEAASCECWGRVGQLTQVQTR